MLYSWKLPEFCDNKFIAVYDEETSPDRFIFKRGNPLTAEQADRKPTFKLKVSKAEITKYDCIANNAGSPLVNQKVMELLLELAPKDVQFLATEIRCRDGVLIDYKLLNITNKIVGIDHKKSIYTKMKQADAILGFKFLTYTPGCMRSHKLSRDAEYLSNLLVTEEIKQAFTSANVTGMWFVRPEDFYRPHTPDEDQGVAERMDEIVIRGQAEQWNQAQYRLELDNMLSDLRQDLKGKRSGESTLLN